MPKLLFINANPKPIEDSYTLRLSYCFLDHYIKSHPEDTVETLNLYDMVPPFITAPMIDAMFNQEDGAYKQWVKQFKSFDKYIIASPNWALGVPAILKAYIDLIVIMGETFYYDDEGHIIGMLQDKKMLLITAAGDNYSAQANIYQDMNAQYLKQIFTALGIEQIKHFGIEGTTRYKESAQNHMSVLKMQMESFAKHF